MAQNSQLQAPPGAASLALCAKWGFVSLRDGFDVDDDDDEPSKAPRGSFGCHSPPQPIFSRKNPLLGISSLFKGDK